MKLHWGNAIFIFFTIFISLSIIFVIFSLRQDNDLTQENYYEKGANYTQQIHTNQRSAIYNDSISIKQINNSVLVTLPSSVYNYTDSLKVHFYNPSSKSKDFKVLLSSLSDTNYIEIESIFKGRYIMKLHWLKENSDYMLDKQIMLK